MLMATWEDCAACAPAKDNLGPGTTIHTKEIPLPHNSCAAGCVGHPAVHDDEAACPRGHLGNGALRGGLGRWRLVDDELLQDPR